MRVHAKATNPEDHPEIVAAHEQDVAEEELLGIEGLLGPFGLPEQHDSRGETDREQDCHRDVAAQAAPPSHGPDGHRRERRERDRDDQGRAEP
jgi:hypothetical protein